ncbi:MAG: hypothetical protein CMI06_07990 [Oceanospirillaceae bacterium]|nr:hypothetical protein [Oceanospirillaceae bacterium]|tara:strand:+ start:130 stop:351 length:222 start_codon:yes stop_codon:yes gene_type:complete
MNVLVVCGEAVTVNSDGSPVCPSGWLTQIATVPFDVSQINPEVATAMFGAGFALFITPWAAAWGISQMFKLLR